MARKAPARPKSAVRHAHEVVDDALRSAGDRAVAAGGTRQTAHAEVAAKLGVSTSLLYKWREPSGGGSGQPNPLERAALLSAATADPSIIEWLCRRAGGRFAAEKPEAEPNLGRAANGLVRDFSLLIANVVQATDDSEVDAAESRHLRKRWDELRRKAEAFVHTCEEGGYGRSK
jgi:transposase-like protein